MAAGVFDGQEISAAYQPRAHAGVQGAGGLARQNLGELAKQFDLHPNQIADWKRQLFESAAGAFGGGQGDAEPVDLAPLHAKISQQALELDFLAGALTKAGLLSVRR